MKFIPLELDRPRLRLALLDLAEIDQSSCAELARRYLADEERAELAELQHPARRVEWLGARICVKRLLWESGCRVDPRDCKLVKDERGRPWLTFRDQHFNGVYDCSLSHKGRYACAGLVQTPGARLGVDIEEISPRLRRLSDLFVTTADRRPHGLPDETQLTTLWALKESASKVMGLGLGVGLSEVVCAEVTSDRARIHVRPNAILSAWHVTHQDYVIAASLLLPRAGEQTSAGQGRTYRGVSQWPDAN